MKLFKNSDKRTVSTGLAISLGAAVMLFVVLNFTMVAGWFGKIASYIYSTLWGLAVAYLIRPFTKWVRSGLPAGIKSEKTRARISAGCSLALILIIVILLFFVLTPRLFESVGDFIKNFDVNLESFKKTIKDLAANISFVEIKEESIDKFIGDSEVLYKNAGKWVQENYEIVAEKAMQAVNILVDSLIIITIAAYALFDMDNIKRNVKRVETALFGKEKTQHVNMILGRGDALMTNFLSSNIIDALIIGVVNFIFLTLLDAPYTLVLSIILGATNFVPTFGPVVGGVVGGLIILLTDSGLLLPFIIFTLVLQQIDGNVLKPILFGDSTGLSGFWVMVAIVVGGKMFGVLGMILGVPVVAFIGTILDDVLSRVNGSDDLKAPPKGGRKFSLSALLHRRKKESKN